MNLLVLLFLFLNALHLIWTVNEPKDGKIRPTFDEIYGKGWDKNDHQQIKVETSPINSGENALNEQADHDNNIDQNVEAYNSDSTDQNLTQEDPDRIDQNLTQEDPDCIDQSNDETIEGINDENEFTEQEKREIISKFHAMREEVNKKGKFPATERLMIERKIGIKLGVNRSQIYKWKKEFCLSRKHKRNLKSFYEKKKREFIARIDEIKMCQRGEQNKLAKDLAISRDTFFRWKKEFGLSVNSKIIYSENEKLQLMKKYFKIKQRNLKISESDIANILNIPRTTLFMWKKEFINSIDEHSLPFVNKCLPAFSESEKLELMEKYYKIKQINPKLNVTDIAKRLNIGIATLYRWKRQFDGPTFNKNSIDEHSFLENLPSFADNDTSEHPMPSSDDNLWAWNLTKKKKN